MNINEPAQKLMARFGTKKKKSEITLDQANLRSNLPQGQIPLNILYLWRFLYVFAWSELCMDWEVAVILFIVLKKYKYKYYVKNSFYAKLLIYKLHFIFGKFKFKSFIYSRLYWTVQT